MAFTKTAALAISHGLAKRVAGTGVTVNAILPGPTLSDGFEVMLQEVKEKSGLFIEETAAVFVRENRPSFILQRTASIGEVANLVVYAASPQASAPARPTRRGGDRLGFLTVVRRDDIRKALAARKNGTPSATGPLSLIRNGTPANDPSSAWSSAGEKTPGARDRSPPHCRSDRHDHNLSMGLKDTGSV
jgi:hypothetical protein